MRSWACEWWRIRQHIFLTLNPPHESLHRVSSSRGGIAIFNFTQPSQDSKRTVMASRRSRQPAFRFVSKKGCFPRWEQGLRSAGKHARVGGIWIEGRCRYSSGRRTSALAAPRSMVKDEKEWAETGRNLGKHHRLPSNSWRPDLSEYYWLIELAVAENALFAFPPIRRTVPTTMIRITASMTAYSAIS
jgi:hypothetical protein